jgi:BirA family biotin operon repressor/biotin-[acetyl-CoA-carboxylase] ligase
MGPVKALGQDSLARAVRAAGIDVPPVWFDEVGSTNDEARRLAREGAPEWTVVAAGHQTAGRGRMGRSWIDVPGGALLLSVVLRPQGEVVTAPLLGMLAAAQVVEASGDPTVSAKWPNDLVRDDRKIGGILPEAEVSSGVIRFVVIGVGVNLASSEDELPGPLRSSAGSLVVAPDTLVARFLRGLRRYREATPASTLTAYRRVSATLGQRVRATTTSGELIEGTAVDLDERGGLVVERDGRRTVVAFGEVAHVTPSASSGPP